MPLWYIVNDNLIAMYVEINKGTVVSQEYQIGTIMLVVVFFIYLTLMFIPLPFDYKFAKEASIHNKKDNIDNEPMLYFI